MAMFVLSSPIGADGEGDRERAKGGPLPVYRVYPQPVESPIHTSPPPPADAREAVVDPASMAASPFGWHDTDGVAGAEFTITRGNNVSASLDLDANNTPDGAPDGGPDLEFDFPIDLDSGPEAYRPAAVANLFYWTNLSHDFWWSYGFDEPAGNFQTNNYGNGGLGGDELQAEAQDGSGTNGGNMAVPPDGTPPRMQMFVWTLTTPHRDAALDDGVVVHEYFHGVSRRLAGGPGNVSCLSNQEQIGEGWSDFAALIQTMPAGATGDTARGIGTYLLGQAPDGPGFRGAPYSTDMKVDPRTYADTVTAAVPHGIGAIGASILLEVYWELVGVHGFNPDLGASWETGGNNLATQLVVDGLKLQPCSPGFVDVRNAILAADTALTGGSNQCPLWRAFARRGLGASASQGSSFSNTDNVAAFDQPLACAMFVDGFETGDTSAWSSVGP
jgi:hypothetical protein